MKTMRKLYDQTCEEAESCICYSKCAMEYSVSDPELSRMYLGMAKTEMSHAQQLDAMTMRKAASKKDETVDPMLMELWEEMHSDLLDKMAHAKAYLEMAQSA